jgi:hypothetical protein
MNAVEKAKRDVERGDHWLARQRLESYLGETGYDPELLKLLGSICYDMHDAYNAGRAWLASTAQGEHVDQAIDAFLEHAGDAPESITVRLPRAARLGRVEDYPTIVQQRLRAHGLAESITAWRPLKGSRQEFGKWTGRVIMLCLALVLALVVCSCVAGLPTVFGWFVPGD